MISFSSDVHASLIAVRMLPLLQSLPVLARSLAVAGGMLPREVQLDGVDLIPYLRGLPWETLAGRVLFWRTGGGQSFAARKGPLKLVRIGQKPVELYNLATEIGEASNLADARSATVDALQKELEKWNAELVALRWPNPMPAKRSDLHEPPLSGECREAPYCPDGRRAPCGTCRPAHCRRLAAAQHRAPLCRRSPRKTELVCVDRSPTVVVG